MEERSFYKDATVTHLALFGAAAMAMIGFSIYLTSHYFAVKFPTGLATSSLCDLNSFFNCDTATNSPASNIAGVPISMFGILTGFIGLIGFMFKNEKVEATNVFVLGLNAIGCSVLFLYSLIALGSLCPFCTLYYVASFVAFFIIYKNSSFRKPEIMPLASYGVIAAIIFGLTLNNVNGRTEKIKQLASSLINQYNGLQDLGAPSFDSEFRMASASEKFTDAPIQITKFSDFECPACKALSDILAKVGRRYKGKVNIQYFFYPLDAGCNPSMTRQLHQNACRAAYLSACLPQKFDKIEHEIFALQGSRSFGSQLEKIAKREGVDECFRSKETKEKVQKYIAAAGPFNVRSTPTFLLNGKKIEGALPLDQMSILIDSILEKK